VVRTLCPAQLHDDVVLVTRGHPGVNRGFVLACARDLRLEDRPGLLGAVSRRRRSPPQDPPLDPAPVEVRIEQRNQRVHLSLEERLVGPSHALELIIHGVCSALDRTLPPRPSSGISLLPFDANGHHTLVTGKSTQPPDWLRTEARCVYGVDPEGYDAGRPEYPGRVYELLETRCGVGPGTEALEIGAGTGRVTRRLVDLGAAVTAVEPDPGLAEYLAAVTEERSVKIIVASFEEAPLVDEVFDVAVAAMSFHWIDQQVGLTKLGRVLRPGGCAALWWTVFGDPDRPDPFNDATKRLLEENEALATPHQPLFELDVEGRTQDLANGAGLVDAEGELIHWTIRLDPAAVRALYASMIRVRRRPPDERERLLDVIATIAAREFGGVVERPFVTAVYTARRP
jgi:SAM-dependent methyltransferase